MIIRYYCNKKRIPTQDRENFRAQGLLGLAVALDRVRREINRLDYQVNTYTNSYVKGYLMSYHTILYEKRKSKGWYLVNQPKHFDNIPDAFLPIIRSPEAQVIAKDYVMKALSLLTERQREIFERIHLQGERPIDIAKEQGCDRSTVNSLLMAGREKIMFIMEGILRKVHIRKPKGSKVMDISTEAARIRNLRSRLSKLQTMRDNFGSVMSPKLDTTIINLSDEIDSLTTDLWGGAGPDCPIGRLETAI